MNNETVIEIAKKIAYEAHSGQCRKDGRPYIEHVEHVVYQLANNQNAQVVAWLHDVLEDTETTVDQLLAYGIPKELVEEVVVLTKRREQRYDDYIEKVSQSSLASEVKVADIIANLMDKPGKKQIVKFSKALIRLCSNN